MHTPYPYHKVPKVSICVVTYNQEDYIEECLTSLVQQELPYDFEIIVGDDASTDRTPDIVRGLANKHPGKIIPILHKKNVGVFENYISVHRAAKGDFVCHVDGDDYALPLKIKNQCQFLEQNHDCSAVAHKVKILRGENFAGESKGNPERIHLDHLLMNHPCFLNSSIMYRRVFAHQFLSCKKPFIDFFVYINLVKNGPIGFINEALGVYRAGIGISSSLKLMPLIQSAIDSAQDSTTPQELIKRARAKQYLSYSIAHLLNGEYSKFDEYIQCANRYNPKSINIAVIYRLRRASNLLRITAKAVKQLIAALR